MLERFKKTFYNPIAGLALAFGCLACSGCNPFAPGLDDVIADQDKLMGDRRTVDGFFEWFRNSYQLRDSTLYGQILAPRFTFTYYDFSNNTEVSWDRGTEINTTHKMFRSVQSTSLQWNQYIQLDTISSDTLATAERAFNLIINQNEANVYRGVGTARLILVRRFKGDNWKMLSWYDKSDF